MAFDINEVVAQMLGAIKDTAKDNWDLVKNSVNGYFSDHKSRLELLASLRLNKQISDEFFESRVADEENILESELHSIAIITKAVAQKAANAAIDIFQNAISKALGF
ncbi:hypothetical protein FW778_07385 [Ginsengibacter hankyongi]|uniref:Uncharacterized protein n=1 Tax=Ginsengibacter hankyongi TaxID=2607284 RepID=A0A5J5ILD9_9BACT|nr:hypothetical protein [Ginsengibacter hankyongi]KAA9041830.1 hypothetical protein FW778_07385 [Ginsengibacter hankyongi]